jgi:hypothetical protein
VEFVICQTNQVAHSYEVGPTVDASVLACKGRNQPKDCYDLRVTILDAAATTTDDTATSDFASEHAAGDYDDVYLLLIILVAAVLVLSIVLTFIVKRKSRRNRRTNKVAIGDFRFDKRKMVLSYKDEKIELTSKECDLLQLLYDSANDVVERDTILKWCGTMKVIMWVELWTFSYRNCERNWRRTPM